MTYTFRFFSSHIEKGNMFQKLLAHCPPLKREQMLLSGRVKHFPQVTPMLRDKAGSRKASSTPAQFSARLPLHLVLSLENPIPYSGGQQPPKGLSLRDGRKKYFRGERVEDRYIGYE